MNEDLLTKFKDVVNLYRDDAILKYSGVPTLQKVILHDCDTLNIIYQMLVEGKVDSARIWINDMDDSLRSLIPREVRSAIGGLKK